MATRKKSQEVVIKAQIRKKTATLKKLEKQRNKSLGIIKLKVERDNLDKKIIAERNRQNGKK